MMNRNLPSTGFLLVSLLCLTGTLQAQVPTVTKYFDDERIEVGEVTRIYFTVDNSANPTSVASTSLTDEFPAGLQIASPAGLSFPCTGGFSTDSENGIIEFNIEVDAGETCTMSLNIEGAAAGLQQNVTSEVVTSNGNGPPATADIVVQDPGTPLFTKAFTDTKIELGEVTTLTFTLDNTAQGSPANTLSFVDNLPANIQVATPDNLSSDCTGTPLASGSQVSFSGSVGAGVMCTISVDVVGVSIATMTNVSDHLVSSLGDSGPAIAEITVLDTPLPRVTKVFTDDRIEVGGVTTLFLTFENLSVVTTANSVQLVDNLPAGLQEATPPNFSTDCTGTVTPSPAQITVDITLLPQEVCSVQMDVEGLSAGLHQNVTSEMTSSIGTSDPATASIVVGEVGTPVFSKAFDGPTLGEGNTSVLTFTIDNSANGSGASGLSFSDTLPAGLEIANPANETTTCVGGTLTAVPGSAVFNYSGGTTAANTVCDVKVDVLGISPGIQENISGDLTSNFGNSGPSLASVTILDAPGFSKEFFTDYLSVGGVTTLKFVIDNSTSLLPAGGLTFSDTLPAGLAIANPPDATTTCTGGTLTAIAGADTITYSDGLVDAGAICLLFMDVEAVGLGVQNNLTSELMSNLGTTPPAIASIDVIKSVEWAVAGPADWFDASNWNPMNVPSLALNAGINNGGEAIVPTGSPQAYVHDLYVGLNGGSGTLSFESDFSADIELSGALNIGVTLSGASTSVGTVNFGEDSGFGFRGSPNGPLRIGVTTTDGDAVGSWNYMDNSLAESANFDYVEIGVSDGAGSANGTFLAPNARTSGPRADDSSLFIGVAHGDGNATALVDGTDIDDFSTVDIGVSHGTGAAVADVTLGFTLEGTNNAGLRGPLNIGVSNGSGSAEASVAQQLNVSGGITLENFTELNVGVANSTGNATGAVFNSNGISLPMVTAGTSPGGGTGTGHIYVDHGLLDTDSLLLGAGATLEFAANRDVRATGGNSIEIYSAANADSATLAGNLILNLQYIPTGPTTFEMVNSASPTGITGMFDNVVVTNLPSGFSVSQSVQLDGGGDEQLVVELTGTPDLPEWTNPVVGAGAGDWFTGSNWSSGNVPLASDPATVMNGGEALADSGINPGPIVGTIISIGKDGGAGILNSNGVDIEAGFSFIAGQVSPLISAEQTAAGTLNLTNADIILLPVISPDTSSIAQIGILGLGYAQGGGTSNVNVTMNGGTLSGTGDIYVGAALPIATDATPTAMADLLFLGDGIGVSEIRTNSHGNGSDNLYIAWADDSPSGPNATANAIAAATISDASIFADLFIASVSIGNENGMGEAMANPVILENLEIDGDLEISAADSFGPNATTISDAHVIVSNVTFTAPDNDFRIADSFTSDPGDSATANAIVEMTDVVFNPALGFSSIGSADAFDGGTSSSVADVTLTRVTMETTGEIDISPVNISDPGDQATSSTMVNIVDSSFIFDELTVGEIVAFGGVSAGVSSNVVVSGSSLVGETFAASNAFVNGTPQISSTVDFSLVNSTMEISEDVVIAGLQGNGTDAGNVVDAGFAMTSSHLTAASVEIASNQTAAGSLFGALTLNPSLIETANFETGPDTITTFMLEGINRVSPGTVGQSDLYPAIDTDTAVIEGEVFVNFDFVPPAGIYEFDLIVGDTSLDISGATLTVANLPDLFSIDFFGVEDEEGIQVLRLIISGGNDLAISKVSDVGFANQGDPVTFTITVENLGASDVTGAEVFDLIPGTLDKGTASWTCVPSGAASCTASGNGDIQDMVDIPVGDTLVYTLTATVIGDKADEVVNTASVSPLSGAPDGNPSNNSDTATVHIGLFYDGFESQEE